MSTDQEIQQILKDTKTIAVVGISHKPHRASYQVAKFLIEKGYTVIPVNPKYEEVLGQACYAKLEDIPVDVDMVDCFRRSEEIVPIAESAIRIGAKVLWMQLGVENDDAAEMAKSAGMQVVVNRCPKIDYRG
ncbi:CoA-binding protein [Leucothrix mucor]|uniref:CoA-binding protein n=1 Tax=Leucothrix mucor TaxID=45248 RepID=UPI0003B4C6B3|nr:CoA-binding protein [Leucothrix mucor]